MSSYGRIGSGAYAYSSSDVMRELQGAGWQQARTAPGGYAQEVGAGPSVLPMDAYPQFPANFSGPNAQPIYPAELGPTLAAPAGQGFKEVGFSFPEGMAAGGFSSTTYGSPQGATTYGTQDARSIQPSQNIYEGAVDIQYREKSVVAERLLEVRRQMTQTMKPRYTFEKVIEVPQVVIKESTREVPKPEIIERIIEVPKTEIQEKITRGPPQVEIQEQIVEMPPQVVVEERVVHVPKREVQERLIEVPKVEFVERLEYDDFVEYREVPVDKIIEVPEIEYRVRQVEEVVPQDYIFEYFQDRYKEVPVTQVQEVERIEYVPIILPPGYNGPVVPLQQMVSEQKQLEETTSTQATPPSYVKPAPMAEQSTMGTQFYPVPQQQSPVEQSYTSYEPPGAAAPSGILSSANVAQMAPGSQFLVRKGVLPGPGPGAGVMTPPMAPGSGAAAVNPFDSVAFSPQAVAVR